MYICARIKGLKSLFKINRVDIMEKDIMEKDAFGQVLLNYYKKQPSFEIIERDDGHINLSAGGEYYFSTYPTWRKHEKKAIRYVRGRSLDIGCGAGRVLLYLQDKEIDAEGIDISPLAIKVCKLRGVKNVKLMNIKDIRYLNSNKFDTIIMFTGGFALFSTPNNAKRILKEMYKITSDNGIIIAESRDPYITNNPIHFRYHKNNMAKGKIAGQMRVRIRFLQYSTDWINFLLVSKKEMAEILKGTGWKIKRFIDSEDFNNDGQYIAIIEKI